MKPQRALLALLLLLGPVAAQQTGEEQEGPVRARVRGDAGKGRIQAQGRGDWSPLADGAPVKQGDRVEAQGRPLELLLGDDPQGERAGTTSGDRLVLAPGAQVTVAPRSGADVHLEQGDVFAVAMQKLRLAAGKEGRLVTVTRGDSAVSLERGGKLTVTPITGSASVGVGGEVHDAAAGRSLVVDSRGRVRVRKAKPRLPRFVLQRRVPKTLLFAERFDPWPSGRYAEFNGKPLRGGIAQSEYYDIGEPGGYCSRIYLGRSTPEGGLFLNEPGAILRLRYFLPEPVEALVCTIQQDELQLQVPVPNPRTGAWTELEIDLGSVEDKLLDEGEAALKLRPSEPVTYLGLGVNDHGDQPEHTEAYHDSEVRLDEIVAYIPRE